MPGVAVVFTIVELTVLAATSSCCRGPSRLVAFLPPLRRGAGGGAMARLLRHRWRCSVCPTGSPGASSPTTPYRMQGAGRLVGAAGTVIWPSTWPTCSGGVFLVSVDGEQWGALAADDTALPAGTRIRVRAIQGTRLVVEPFPATEPRGTP
ncbi:MAG: NfeD family protein [Acidimicrobiales bacterium]